VRPAVVIPAPSLLIDEMSDAPMDWLRSNVPNNYSYYSMINDQVAVDAILASNPATFKTNKYRINGFEGRTVRKMMLQFLIPANVEQFVGQLFSYSQYNETYQFYLGNNMVLPEPENSTTKQDRVNQTWGDMNILYDQYQVYLNTNLNMAVGVNVRQNGDPFYQTNARCASYGAINFANTKLNDLQLEYTRSNTGVAGENAPALSILLFGEALRVLTYDSDGSAISTFV